MIAPWSPEYEVQGNKQFIYDQLKDIPSEELEELTRDLFSKHKGAKLDHLILLANPDHDYYYFTACLKILTERHGSEHLENLFEIRDPKGLRERIRSFFGEVYFTRLVSPTV